MNYVKRDKYLGKIAPFVDQPVVKVLTGMRRVGKSTLLQMIQEELLPQVNPQNMISINLESGQYLQIKDGVDFYSYIQKQVKDLTGKLYFFIDEVQLVDSWERVINALRVDYECDIYLTGSNSSLLSSDLSTLLAGRYVSFEIQSFTFSEFIHLYRDLNLDKEELFQQFISLGGMPSLRYFQGEKEASYKYLNDIYNTVVVKDILEYQAIRDVDLFNRILRFCLENIGQTFSANSLRKYFASQGRKVSVDTVLNYLTFCQRAYLLKKVERYDTIGKKILTVDEKYYLTDHGFRQAVGFSNEKAIERVLENIVYIELLSRGYQVQIGRVRDKEIDFIASKQGQISYYQVSYLMESKETRDREFSVYSQIKDNFPKYVLSLDSFDFSQDGVIHKNLIDFLLGE
ncbi:ATP-binding protein [Aerococcus sp. Group 2]|uniref:ATP-binding protein n=1 Tax=Aerococcus sp. Group 2 TaxID=2976811 RepID=UPI00227C3842|nr:ATP-binding protein [Aerococcus sp. Group 2]MCY3039755.1 ATP-binding protein [Aerococcus sp. Group 2]MCY3041563.1 ATP-binding protein [Aerococcus sp. Group 2]MCY3043218.1 ATP-binding protein [Aerococcus sp. Group 2]